MPIEVLTRQNFRIFKPFCELVWDRPRSETYYEWRYFSAPGLVTYSWNRDGACQASLGAFERQYHAHGRLIECYETVDWYAAPAKMGSGAGIKLMKHLMDLGKPIVALGGTEYTTKLLPRLGFKVLEQKGFYFHIPLTSNYYFHNRNFPVFLQRALANPINAAFSLLFTPSLAGMDPELKFVPVSFLDQSLLDMDDSGTFRSVVTPQFLEWLTKGFQAAGTYLPIKFEYRGEAAGWALIRLYREGNLFVGSFLDIRLRRKEHDIAVRAIRKMIRLIAGFGVDLITSEVTSVFFAEAYRRSGFRNTGKPIPDMIWPGTEKFPFGELCMSHYMRGDESFIPLPTSREYAASYSAEAAGRSR